MDATGVDEGIELVARRLDFLEALSGDPLDKRDLVERLDHSRSTVDRAVRELEEAHLVTRETRGWVATQSGRLAARRYREFRDEQADILTAREVLTVVPREYDLPASLVRDADVLTGEDARGLVDALADRLRDVDRYRAVLPTVADSRHLRLLYACVVRDGLDAELTLPEEALGRLTDEFPELTAELANADAATVRTGDAPPFGLVLTGEDDPAVTLVAYEDGDVTGVVHTDDPDSVAWARDVIDDIDADATDATADVLAGASGNSLPSLTGDRLPMALRSEGFVRVDEAYFDRREPMDPATAWRVGLGLPEVAAGYAVERRFENGDPVAGRVRDPLADGENVALLGPPGSGKSTVCKRVACEGFEAGDTVLYREAGAGQPVESVAALEQVLARVDGRTVVVVEDAMRPEASGVLEALRSHAGDADVVFLLDARESEWYESTGTVTDARLDAFRRTAVETVGIPRVTAGDCERFVDRVEAVVDEEVPATGAAVYDAVTDERGETSARTARLAFDRIARYVSPLREDVPSSLDEDVDAVRAGLADRGAVATEVGFAVNLCNAAGLALSPLYVYAAVCPDDGEVDDDRVAAVAAALDWLEGRVLFEGERGGTPYRAVHETWSAGYIERFLAANGEAAARNRFRECLSGLLSLAEKPRRRRSLAAAAGEGVGVPDTLVRSPGGWADATARSLYVAGREYPKFEPLYGEETGTVTLPTGCSRATELECTALLAWMNIEAGRLDRAERAFEAVRTAEDGADVRVALDGLRGLAEIARYRGEADAANEYASDLLERAVDAGDPRTTGQARLTYARLLRHKGAYDEARQQLSMAERAFDDCEYRYGVVRVALERGRVANSESDFDEATEQFEHARTLARDLDDRRGVTEAVGELGVTATGQSDYETAADRLARAVEEAREIGDRRAEARYLVQRGKAAVVQFDTETGLEYLREAETIARNAGLTAVTRAALTEQAFVYQQTRAYDRAKAVLEEALDLAAESENRESQASSLVRLAALHTARNELDEARDRAREAIATSSEIGNQVHELDGRRLLGNATRLAGDPEAALPDLEAAMDLARKLENPQKQLKVAVSLSFTHLILSEFESALTYAEEIRELDGPTPSAEAYGRMMVGYIANNCEEYEVAHEHFEASFEQFQAIELSDLLVPVGASLAEACRELGDLDAASRYLEEVEGLVETNGNPRETVGYWSVRALVENDCDRPTDAESCIERAFENIDTVADRTVKANAFLHRGRLERDREELTAARASLRAALELYDRVGVDHRARVAAEELAEVCETLGEERAANRARQVEGDRAEAFEFPAREAFETEDADPVQESSASE